MTALLIVLAIGFAWSIGAHYTGAVMGMPHALRAIGARQALLLMASLAFLGATFASHAVEERVGPGLTTRPLSVGQEVVVIGVAFAVTTFFNRFRMPTSTIQILVFSVVGVALATVTGVDSPPGLSAGPQSRSVSSPGERCCAASPSRSSTSTGPWRRPPSSFRRQSSSRPWPSASSPR